jgi:hypothetical protein
MGCFFKTFILKFSFIATLIADTLINRMACQMKLPLLPSVQVMCNKITKCIVRGKRELNRRCDSTRKPKSCSPYAYVHAEIHCRIVPEIYLFSLVKYAIIL